MIDSRTRMNVSSPHSAKKGPQHDTLNVRESAADDQFTFVMDSMDPTASVCFKVPNLRTGQPVVIPARGCSETGGICFSAGTALRML
jgi:hypothetical protein